MTQDEAFRRTILANPDDDLPRLVYADYLDETGDSERAAFIRLQCDPASINSPRVTELLGRWGAKWLPRSIRPKHPHQWHVSADMPGAVFFDWPTLAVDSDYPFFSFLRFTNGFVGEIHAQIPTGLLILDGEQAMQRFADTAARVFASQPLHEIVASFENTNVTATFTIGSVLTLVRRPGVEPERTSWRMDSVCETAERRGEQAYKNVFVQPSRKEFAATLSAWIYGKLYWVYPAARREAAANEYDGGLMRVAFPPIESEGIARIDFEV